MGRFKVLLIIIGAMILGWYIATTAEFMIHTHAVEEAEASAENGDDHDQLILALMYHKGWKHLEPNESLAVKWYKRSARNGNRVAKRILCSDFDICTKK